MSDPDGFDTRLAAHFEQEHRHAPADSFVADTMQQVRAERRSAAVVRVGVRVAALAVAVAASPWLIATVSRLNAAVESSLSWAQRPPGVWALAALGVAVIAALAWRVRGR